MDSSITHAVALGINSLDTNRNFTESELGIRPGVETFENDLEKLMRIVKDNSPAKKYFLAQRLGHNTECLVIGQGDITRDWSNKRNYCSPLLIRTKELKDSIIFPREGVWIEDSYGRINLNAENMVSLIMGADCPGIFIDTPEFIAVVHASIKVLNNDEDHSSGLGNTLKVLVNDLDVSPRDIKVYASHGIGPDLYSFSLTHEKWGEKNRARHKRLKKEFGSDAAVERGGNSHVNLMEIIRQQLLMAGLTEDQFHLDKRCTAGVVDGNGDFLYPSNSRGDVPQERFAVCRWV